MNNYVLPKSNHERVLAHARVRQEFGQKVGDEFEYVNTSYQVHGSEIDLCHRFTRDNGKHIVDVPVSPNWCSPATPKKILLARAMCQ